MEEEEAARSATPFAPRSSLSRTPPSSFGPVAAAVAAMERTPAARPLVPSAATKRPLTSPEDRQEDMARARRFAVSGPPRPAIQEVQGEEEDVECDAGDSLVSATKLELLDRVNQDLERIMGVVTAQTSRLNKEATNTVRSGCQDILAVIAALSIKLGDMEIECGKSRLRTAEMEQELLKIKMAAQTGPGATSSGATAVAAPSYATTLKLAKKAEPRLIPAAQGPVLAWPWEVVGWPYWRIDSSQRGLFGLHLPVIGGRKRAQSRLALAYRRARPMGERGLDKNQPALAYQHARCCRKRRLLPPKSRGRTGIRKR